MDPATGDRRERAALVGSCGVAALVLMLQAPGRIIPETKLDLTLDPIGFLSRALAAWDPTAAFGRVQNQAVGYLFPMGAWSALGERLGLDPWIVQRLWITIVVSLSLVGAHRVARAIGIATPSGRLVAAWGYAVAPATLGVVAFQSAGQLPYALAPHVLVPLLTARPGDRPRRVAARSCLALVAMGGVNGASAFAVLPLVVIWFATRSPGRDRRRLAAWWATGAVAATLWWFVPLAIAVRYGVRFTAYTEQASLTTATESGTEVLRGTGNWLHYLFASGRPWLPGGWALATSWLAVAGTTLAAAGGLWGLTRRDAPGRSWLVPAAVLGSVAMGIGYAGTWGGALAEPAQALLQGPLVAFRNVHKFAAVARLPLALGLGHLVVVAGARLAVRAEASESPRLDATGERPGRRARRGRRPIPAWAAGVAAGAVIVVSVAPGLDRLTAPGSFEDLPGSWRSVAAWLEEQEPQGRALVLPGAAFGEYRWGRPLDEPLSSLDAGPWAVRDLIPLGGNGSTRLLDGIDRALGTGVAPPGLLPALQRAGVSHLVVRNDLDLSRTGGPRPATVRRVLRTVPGLELVASFGAVSGDRGADGRLSSPPGAAGLEAFREVDVYAVADPGPLLAAQVAAETVVVSGGPEGLLEIDPALIAGRATILATDLEDELEAAIDPARRIATDSARRRDVEFGAVRDAQSYTLTATEPSPITGEDPRDRWPADEPIGLSDATLLGAATLTDSAAGSGLVGRPEAQPFAAFDGDPTTTWSAGGEDEWLEVDFDDPQTIAEVAVSVPATTGVRVDGIRVVTDAGSARARIGRSGTAVVALPPGATDRVRLTVTSITGEAELGPVGLSEVRLGDVRIARPIAVADPGGEGPDVIVVARDRQDPLSAARSDEDGRLDRTFPWAGGRATLRGTASAVPGPELDELIASQRPPTQPGTPVAAASSTFRAMPAFAPTAAIDGDPLTAWVSDEEEGTPSLTISWDGEVLVDAFTVDVLEGLAGAGVDPVADVTVGVRGATFERRIDAAGRITIPSTATDHLELSFPDEDRVEAAGRRVAIAEVQVPALLGRPTAADDPERVVELPCGRGPAIAVDGTLVPTRAAPTVADLADGTPFGWEACAPVALDAGDRRLDAPRTAPTAIASATIARVRADLTPASGTPRSVEVGAWDAERRAATIGRGAAAIVATTENANEGWQATLDGEVLEPVRVDGWRQGWIVPAGQGGQLELTYRPGQVQRVGLATGALALVLLLGTALIGRGQDPTWSPPTERSWRTGPIVALAVLAAASFGAPPVAALALAVVALTAVATGATHRHPPARLGWLRFPTVAAGAMLVAGAVALVGVVADGLDSDLWGSFSGPAQALATLAVVALAGSLVQVSPGAGSTPSSRARAARRGR